MIRLALTSILTMIWNIANILERDLRPKSHIKVPRNGDAALAH